MVAGYVRLIVFAFGLLVGVQVPSFVDQYAKRVSAHSDRGRQQLSGAFRKLRTIISAETSRR
jgi:hypothetical protein